MCDNGCDAFDQHFYDAVEVIIDNYLAHRSRPKVQRGADQTAIDAAKLNKRPGFWLIIDNLVKHPDHRNTAQEIADATKRPTWNGPEWARDEITPRIPELREMGLICSTADTRPPPSVGKSKRHANNRVHELIPPCQWTERALRLLTPPSDWDLATEEAGYDEKLVDYDKWVAGRRQRDDKRLAGIWRRYVEIYENGVEWRATVTLPRLVNLFGEELRQGSWENEKQAQSGVLAILLRFAEDYNSAKVSA